MDKVGEPCQYFSVLSKITAPTIFKAILAVPMYHDNWYLVTVFSKLYNKLITVFWSSVITDRHKKTIQRPVSMYHRSSLG